MLDDNTLFWLTTAGVSASTPKGALALERPGLHDVLTALSSVWRGVGMQGKAMSMSYGRFAAMIVVGTLVMYGLMYLNTYAVDHVFYSQTRTWMAIVMGATMAVIMLTFMWSMYSSLHVNVAILVGSAVVFAVALWLVRSQETVDEIDYMKAMIPHHSIAILTSERARIRDPRVRLLADRIIDAQVREISEMKRLIDDLERSRTPDGSPELQSYRKRGAPPPPPGPTL